MLKKKVHFIFSYEIRNSLTVKLLRHNFLVILPNFKDISEHFEILQK